jgi:hypothetical protein
MSQSRALLIVVLWIIIEKVEFFKNHPRLLFFLLVKRIDHPNRRDGFELLADLR